MKNLELSRIFEQINRILKIKGENPFKIRAYEKVALVLENLAIDIETIYRQGGLNNIPGVGSAIAQKIEEFLTTGKILSKLDVVIAAIHSGFKQESKVITKRIIEVMQNRFVSTIAHPTGRLIGYRESYQVDINEMIKVAAETGTILEINSHPERLDLNDIHCRMAKDRGVQLAIETDAHSIDGLELMNLGVDVARRGWLEEKDIVNTLPLDKLLKRLKNR